jgi:chromosome segregation ATPase
VAELTHLVELLREEAKSARQERDEVVLSMEQCKLSHDEACVQHRLKLATLQSERGVISDQHVRDLNEIERKDASIRASKQTIEDLTARLELAQKQASDAEKHGSLLKEEHARHCAALSASASSERSDLLERLQEAQDRLAEKEDALRRYQRDAMEAAAAAESTYNDTRRAHHQQMQEARRKYSAVRKTNLFSSPICLLFWWPVGTILLMRVLLDI